MWEALLRASSFVGTAEDRLLAGTNSCRQTTATPPLRKCEVVGCPGHPQEVTKIVTLWCRSDKNCHLEGRVCQTAHLGTTGEDAGAIERGQQSDISSQTSADSQGEDARTGEQEKDKRLKIRKNPPAPFVKGREGRGAALGMGVRKAVFGSRPLR